MNFRRETIDILSNTLGLSYENAEKLQRRLYRQALRRYGETRPFVASRELYYSVKSSQYGKIKISQDYMNVEKVGQDTPREILKSRMKNLIKKTGGMKGEVGSALNAYLKKEITYKEFKASVLATKRSAEYKSKQKEKVKKK